jgi:hypothetical protein
MIASSLSHLVLELGRFQMGLSPFLSSLLAAAVVVVAMAVLVAAVVNFAITHHKVLQEALRRLSPLVRAALAVAG